MFVKEMFNVLSEKSLFLVILFCNTLQLISESMHDFIEKKEIDGDEEIVERYTRRC